MCSWMEAMIVFVKWSLGGRLGSQLAWFLPAEQKKCVWGPKELPQCEWHQNCIGFAWDCEKEKDVTSIDTLNQHQIKIIKLILTHWTDVISPHTETHKRLHSPSAQTRSRRMRVAGRDSPCSVFAVWIICASDTDSDKCVQGYSCVLPYWCWGNVLSLFIKSITTYTHEDRSHFSLCSFLPSMHIPLFWCVDASACTLRQKQLNILETNS